ncbi:MAG: MBL fold metallo-hydrolase [Candidatus Promineifilaceae bacterium]|nr:MBL fold metallo-hydrolase [Candidatus Promineifilaceae bacterium]
MEIVPGLHWIKGLLSNIYLWASPAGLLLVDTGSWGDASRIRRHLDACGYRLSDIAAIFITHADMDHAGNAARLQAATGAPIIAGQKTATLLQQGRSPQHLPTIVQFLTDRLFKYPLVAADDILVVEADQPVPEQEAWLALATPGHSPDHMSFYSPTHGIVFAGDALANRRQQLGVQNDQFLSDPIAARLSAMRLLRLTPAVLACGHGPPLYGHSAEEIMHLHRRLQAESV